MIGNKGTVCILQPQEVHALEHHDERPWCRNHRHISKAKAEELIGDNVVTLDERGNYTRILTARWVGKGKRYIVYERAREWKKVMSGGFEAMQLVPGGGAL